jgi:hypothetical protein
VDRLYNICVCVCVCVCVCKFLIIMYFNHYFNPANFVSLYRKIKIIIIFRNVYICVYTHTHTHTHTEDVSEKSM